MWNRRNILIHSAQLAAYMAVGPVTKALAQASDTRVHLTLAEDAATSLPADFMGLGYEMSSVAPLGLLSAENSRYVRLAQQLGPRGVIRVGGIVADYTSYDADGTIAAEPKHTVITRASLEQFAGFLRKTGWTAIWSVNFAQGTVEQATVVAQAVASTLGDRLQAFEIGNEVDNYGHGGHAFRTPPYTYETYRAEYEQWRAAILRVVPTARFAAPDTASSIEWVERMAADARGSVQLLTTHYYRNGQQQGTAEQLARPDDALRANLIRLRAAAQSSGIPWRMCETNSFSGGGRPGVSDTFLGALWTLDFMLLLARYGCSGVNMETGVNQLGFISSYSPIQDNGKGTQSAGVPYYGMLAFAEAARGCSQVRAVVVPETASGLTAYALGDQGIIHSVVLVNRGTAALDVSMARLGLTKPRILRLTAPAMDSKTDVTLAGSAVDDEGRWQPANHEVHSGREVTVAAGSAMVLRSNSRQ